jgi:hypothetical protein
MPKVIHGIQTTLGEEESNPMNVVWDMEVEYDIPFDRHDDNSCQITEEYRSVAKIKYVEVVLLDKCGLPVTEHFTGMGASRILKDRLEKMLLKEVSSKSIAELIGEEVGV